MAQQPKKSIKSIPNGHAIITKGLGKRTGDQTK